MSNRLFLLLTMLSVGLIALISFTGAEKKENGFDVDPAFAGYISAYTSGTISTTSDIRVILASDHPQAVAGAKTDKNLFSFDPSIKGEAVWLNERTIVFRPASRLEHDQEYKAEFQLDKLLDTDLGEFEFSFRTMPQSLQVKVEQLKLYNNRDLSRYFIEGTLQTADVADAEAIAKVLSAEQDGATLPLKWQHEPDGRTHRFVIDSISRRERPGTVDIIWNGEAAGSENQGETSVRIPAMGEFSVHSVQVRQAPEQYAIVNFSDPLDPDQALDGIVSLARESGLRFSINDNNLIIYPSTRLSGERELTIQPTFKNILGHSLGAPYRQTIRFEELKPEVRLTGDGVIVPTGEGMVFPFQAVSLHAVEVKVVRIFEKNIAQFLQINQLDEGSELRRVGRKVLHKVVPLDNAGADYSDWKNYSLDLSTLMKAEPGAIYRVNISFRPEYSAYHCETGTANSEEFVLKDIESDDNEDNPDYYYYDDYDYEYYGDEEYDWDQRNNPCHSMYYRTGRSVSRNILASSLGLIAKQGTDGKMLVIATDLVSGSPLQDVELKVLNYQQQEIANGRTAAGGFADISLSARPFLLIASQGTQKGYLRLDEGSSLPLSAFDVSGENVQKGIKGFIYTERGVWRPGDSIHVSFILEDETGNFPDDHPVHFDLVNPLGQTVHTTTRSNGLNGFYYFGTATTDQSPTGNYTARVKVGGATFTKTLKVETIVPNRLKLALTFPGEKLEGGREERGTLNARWLHGATAGGLKAKVDMTLTSSTEAFPKFKEYHFTDEGRSFPTEEVELFTGTLNAEGNTTVPFRVKTENAAPGVLNAWFSVRVFEEGGAFSIDRFMMPYYPYTSFAGLKIPKGDKYNGTLQTDSDYVFPVISLTPGGQPVTGQNLTAEIYKLDWRWWWDRRGDEAEYLNRYYHRKKETMQITTDGSGRASWQVRIPRHEWGRYLLRVVDEESGHATSRIVYFDWPYWDRGSREMPGAASMLMFSSDKEKYQTGETVRITLPTPDAGKALITVENGSGILRKEWIETSAGETVWTFNIEKGMAPNLYVSVMLVQPYRQTANDLPIRLYGVLPVAVEDPGTRLQPLIETASVFRPEQNAEIRVSEKEGRAMTYTIAIVDEGLLDLTRFKTPDPWAAFYAREALGVKTWDLYDHVLGAQAGLQRILAVGGDDAASAPGTPKANRFKPMVRFLGPFTLAANRTASHKVDIPRYVGSVRVMVVAGQDAAYGHAEKAVPVRKPLMLLATLPRILATGETVRLPVNVFAMEKNIREVNVRIGSHTGFRVQGELNRTINFETTGDQLVWFELESALANTVGKVSITATSGSETATEEIEIAIRNPNQPEYHFDQKILQAGAAGSFGYEPVGIRGTNKAWLELSTIPAMNLEERLKYLITYPHGCLEQTVSSAFAQLHLGKMVDLRPEEEATISDHVKEALKSLRAFQLPGGGFSYWPGNSSDSEWGTSYAGHFMLEAERLGYALPAGLLSGWKRYQQQKAAGWSAVTVNRYGYSFRNDDLMQAYRLYTLALAGSPESGAMNRMLEKKDLSLQARWRLAAAFYLSGKKSAAETLIANLSTDIKPYRELSYTYGSDFRDRAMILETVALAGNEKQVATLLKVITSRLASRQWLSTQEIAFSLFAVMKAIPDLKPAPLNAEYVINGKRVKVQTQEKMYKIALPVNASNSLEIENKSGGVLFATVIREGVPPLKELPELSNDIGLQVTWTDREGNIIDPSSLAQGTDLVAEVRVSHPGVREDYQELALTIPAASGWEIVNRRMQGVEGADVTDRPEYMDIRDDKLILYFDLARGKSKTFRVGFTATYAGRFYLPPVVCEAMYDRSIFGREGGRFVEVVRPGREM